MKQSKLEEYLQVYPIDQYFSFNIKPYLTLAYYAPGEYILKNQETVTKLSFLAQGTAKLTLYEINGKSFLNLIEAPGFIGEMELLHAQEYANEVCAYDPCVCLEIELHMIREKLLNDACFLRHLCTYLGRESISNLMNYTKNLAFSLEIRLAEFIKMMAKDDIYQKKHTEVACYLGVSYRHLLSVFADFVRKGILVKEGAYYRIANRAALEEIAGKIKA